MQAEAKKKKGLSVWVPQAVLTQMKDPETKNKFYRGSRDFILREIGVEKRARANGEGREGRSPQGINQWETCGRGYRE